jgi:hypothetical protein
MAFVCTGRAGRPSRAQRLTRFSKEFVRSFAKTDRRVHALLKCLLEPGVRDQIYGDQDPNSITMWLNGHRRVKPVRSVDRVNYVTCAQLILGLKNVSQFSTPQGTNPDGRVTCLEQVWPTTLGPTRRSVQFRGS